MDRAIRAGLGVLIIVAYIALILTLTGCQSYRYQADWSEDGRQVSVTGNARPDSFEATLAPDGTRTVKVENPYVPLMQRLAAAANWTRELVTGTLNRIGFDLK